MKGLFIYVTAGKGHQVPAEALRDAMIRLGHEAVSIDLFDMLHDQVAKRYIQNTWRNELRHPPVERVSNRLLDRKISGTLMKLYAMCQLHMQHYFKKYIEEVKPDFIFGTHYFVNQIIEPYVRTYGFHMPVYSYAPDIFFYPNIGASKHMDQMYVCSSIGRDWMLKQGFRPDQITLCPFPLKQSIESYTVPTQQEARDALGLKQEAFTILMNLGGEGIGNTRLVRRIAKDGLRPQFIVVGRMSRGTARLYRNFEETHPDFPIIAPGFTDKMLDYIVASDIVVGKAGANSMMESIYLKRPFIITEQLYAGFRTSIFLEQYQVGWVENNVTRQAEILERYANDPGLRAEIAHQLDIQPLTFGSEKLVRQVMDDTLQWYRTHR